MELYYTIAVTDRDRGGAMARLYESAGLHEILTLLGRGTATNAQLSVLGLGATEKAVVCAVANGGQARQLLKLARDKLLIDIPGNGIVMTIPLKSVAGGRTLAYLTDENTATGGRPAMDFQHELIIVNKTIATQFYTNNRHGGRGTSRRKTTSIYTFIGFYCQRYFHDNIDLICSAITFESIGGTAFPTCLY